MRAPILGDAISARQTAPVLALRVADQIAPADRRAEMVVSVYFAVGLAGNTIPVIGAGVLSSLVVYTVASIAF